MDTEKVPADLGIKIGTHDQVLWTNVAKEARILIEQSTDNLKVQNALLILAESKIAEEIAKSSKV